MPECLEEPAEGQAPELAEDLAARPCTSQFYASHYDVMRRSIQAGMGSDVFDSALADRMELAFKKHMIDVWVLFLPDDQGPMLAGSITFFIAHDPLLDLKYMYLYSLHCSRKVVLEAWRKPFMDIFRHAEAQGCKTIWARTGLNHVVEIAKDNGFTVSTHLERMV